MWEILNCEPSGYSPEARRTLAAVAHVRDCSPTRKELLDIIPRFDGLIVRLGYRVDEELLARAVRLRFVATSTTGLNHIDLTEAERRGVTIISLRGEYDFLDTISATAELTWGLILGLVRHIPAAHADVCAGNWRRDRFCGQQLHGKRLGILGLGRLGRMVATYGFAFGMDVVACDPEPARLVEGARLCTFEEVFSTADIVSIHVPFSEANRRIVNARALARLKPGAILVNTSRGEIIDEEALLDALMSGALAACALDVLCGENSGSPDWRERNALINYARSHENLLLTPHIGGATIDSMRSTEVFIAKKIVGFLAMQKSSAQGRP